MAVARLSPSFPPLLAAAALLALHAAFTPTSTRTPGDPVFESIRKEDVASFVAVLTAPEMEGRDSPSLGLKRAGDWISERYGEIGLQPLEAGGSFLWSFASTVPAPVASGCSLSLEGAPAAFVLGKDFVPITGAEGQAQGELVFLGFGIEDSKERYDDLGKADLGGKVAMILSGEPRHPKRFDGPEKTPAATLWTKLARLGERKVAGVIVVRRRPAGVQDWELDELPFRHGWASWATEQMTPVPRGVPKGLPPAIEVSPACGSALLGQDVEELAARIDRSVKPVRVESGGRRVKLGAQTSQQSVEMANVVGLVPGSDPALAKEWVVLGAHYDHIGVDDRGRVGVGADDNASGTAALLEVAEALAKTPPRRSVIVCAFAAEEKELVGSGEFCRRLPVPKEALVAMINMDMVGRGDATEVAVLGIVQNPSLEKLLERARKARASGVKKLVLRQGEELFGRSDHYSFHKLGVPTLFFFEGLPLSRNADYHTWRDTPDLIDTEKIARTARLVAATAWILATDDERPPPPRD